MSLVDAARALARGEQAALPALLSAWREAPSVALGDLIHACAPPDDEVGHALAGLSELATKPLIERVQALASLAPDPRAASALTDLVLSPPYTAQAMKPMWTSIFAQLTDHHVDPRALARLRGASLERTFGSTNMASWMSARLAQAMKALDRRFGAGASRLAEEDQLAALVPEPSFPAARPEPTPPPPSAATRSAEQLLALCLAAPEDDEPRLVYADLLEEQGDSARAELINLQIRRAREGGEPGEREQELLRKHAAKWLAPIVPVLKKDSWIFARGFLDSCMIYPRQGKVAELAGHPLWATVRSVTLSETGDPAPIITHPVMAGLRSVRLWTYPRGLAGLLDSDASVEELHHIYLPNVIRDQALWSAFVACSRLPRLRLLQIGGASPERAREVWSGGLARSGLRLVIAEHGYSLAPWWRELIDPKIVPSVTMMTTNSELEVDTRRRSLICTLGAESPALALEDVASALGYRASGDGRLERGVLERVELRVPEGGVPTSDLFQSPQKTISALERHCRQLGMQLELKEGQWETRYVGHHRVKM
jgi:uncharacterized protein (TIGR02996 family)